MTSQAPDTLVLPLPRWPFLWPAAALAVGLLNGTFQFAQYWHGSLGGRVLAVLLLLAYPLAGLSLAVCLVANHWGELRVEGARLLLRPYWSGRFPAWATRLHGGPLAREVALDTARLEWVGRSLLLHAQPEMTMRLDRAGRAETIARWLQAHGVPEPIGR